MQKADEGIEAIKGLISRYEKDIVNWVYMLKEHPDPKWNGIWNKDIEEARGTNQKLKRQLELLEGDETTDG